MSFLKSQRVQLIAAVVVSVIIGWQLGVRDEQNRMMDRFSLPKNAITGTGKLIIDPEKEADLTMFWSVWRDLLRSYIAPQEMNPTELVRGAAEGLVKGVGDPYTVLMPPEDAKEFHQSLDGSLDGIGAELHEKKEYVEVVTPIKGSPAEKAGVKKGDIITEVNGEDIAGWTIDKVVSKVRGQKGTSVTLTIYREKEPKPLKISIIRDTIRIPSVEGKVIQTQTGAVAYIALTQFGDDTAAEVRSAIGDVRKEPLKGMIIDLRGNGGGYLEASVTIASLFLKSGKVVSVEKRDGPPEDHMVTGTPLEPTIPLVVLVNEGSASASEILAGALQDHSRALIVGVKSFGKGTVQEVHDLPDGSTLKVTVARWITPGGKNLAKEGVHPDIVQDITSTDIEAKNDTQLSAAEKAIFTHSWKDGIVQK